jgi:DNA-binding response OmpR family regulator
MPTALFFSPDAQMRDALTAALNRSGIATVATSESDEALRCLTAVRFDVVVLDMLCHGSEKLRHELRALSVQTPVICIAGRYDSGQPTALGPPAADAVILRPVDSSEAVCAVKAALGLDLPAAEGPVTIGQLTIDPDTSTVSAPGARVKLTPTELRIVLCLAGGEGTVVPGDFLFRCVWGTDPGPGTGDVVRSHIRNIRRKLRAATARDDWLVTAPRRGYRLAAD